MIFPSLINLIFTFFIYVFLFGDCACHRNGLIGRIQRYLTNTLPNLLRLCCCCGKCGCCTKVEKYCVYTRHPWLQIFYLSIIIGITVIFLYDILPRCNILHMYFGLPFVGVVLYVFYYCSISEPGTITNSNYLQYKAMYPFDNMIFSPNNICTTCKFEKPARSKHCRVCDRCVSKYDHHCGWINNCVGENNHRWFVLFVLLTALLCTYGFIICSGIIWNIIHANRLFEMYLLKKYSLTFIAQFLIYQGGISFSVGLFAFILAIMLYVFAGSHLYMVCINDTTNESFKWKEVKQYQKRSIKSTKA